MWQKWNSPQSAHFHHLHIHINFITLCDVFCTCVSACDFTIGMFDCCAFLCNELCRSVCLARYKCFTSHSLKIIQLKWMAQTPIPTIPIGYIVQFWFWWREQIVEILCSIAMFWNGKQLNAIENTPTRVENLSSQNTDREIPSFQVQI